MTETKLDWKTEYSFLAAESFDDGSMSGTIKTPFLCPKCNNMTDKVAAFDGDNNYIGCLQCSTTYEYTQKEDGSKVFVVVQDVEKIEDDTGDVYIPVKADEAKEITTQTVVGDTLVEVTVRIYPIDKEALDASE